MAIKKKVELSDVPKARLPKKMADSTERELMRREELLDVLATLGGRGVKDEDVLYKGKTLVLPERWQGDLNQAIEFLVTKRDEDEEMSSFVRVYNFRPWDGAYNAFQAMKKVFGMVSGQTIRTMFGSKPPTYIQVPVSVVETEEVPWGKFSVPLLEDTSIWFGQDESPDFGSVFMMRVDTPRKNKFIVEGLFLAVQSELEQNSIYRGKAIDGQVQPQFIDLRGFDESKVVYSEQVRSDLESSIWGLMRYTNANRKLGLPLKRAVVLSGPYGTGKTLAGFRTAIEATGAGWTFIMARPGRDSFVDVMQTARLYQPCCVFMEDAETIASAERNDSISQLLDVFDGIQSKNTSLIVVLTTNHAESLHKGMMRPGRIDQFIDIGALDAEGIKKLFKANIQESRLSNDIDWDKVIAACDGYLPAFIKEAADRAVRYALVRQKGDTRNICLTTDDLVYAAGGLRGQYNRMQDAPEHSTADSLAEAFQYLIASASKKSIVELATKPKQEMVNSSVWDIQALTKAQDGDQ